MSARPTMLLVALGGTISAALDEWGSQRVPGDERSQFLESVERGAIPQQVAALESRQLDRIRDYPAGAAQGFGIELAFLREVPQQQGHAKESSK